MNLQYLLLFVSTVLGQEKYKQSKQLLNGRFSFFWGVEYDRLYFKILAKNSKFLTLSYSYNDVPTDGFIAGLDSQGNGIIKDIHLDFAGRKIIYNIYKKIEIKKIYC